MVEFKLPFAEGASINRPPIFGGVNYAFWKIRMKIFMKSIDMGIWDAVVNGPFVPIHVVKDETVKKGLIWMEWQWKEKNRVWFFSKKYYHFCLEYGWIFQGITVPTSAHSATSQALLVHQIEEMRETIQKLNVELMAKDVMVRTLEEKMELLMKNHEKQSERMHKQDELMCKQNEQMRKQNKQM